MVESYREAHACKRCIIGLDNRFEEGLDRLDALAVLKRIKEQPQNVHVPGIAIPITPKPIQSQESLIHILDKLIAHPTRNATDADKQFITNFRAAVDNLDLHAPSQGKEFTNGVVHVRALLSWDDVQIAIFSSAKGLDVETLKPVFDGWQFIVIADQIDIAELIKNLKEA